MISRGQCHGKGMQSALNWLFQARREGHFSGSCGGSEKHIQMKQWALKLTKLLEGIWRWEQRRQAGPPWRLCICLHRGQLMFFHRRWKTSLSSWPKNKGEISSSLLTGTLWPQELCATCWPQRHRLRLASPGVPTCAMGARRELDYGITSWHLLKRIQKVDLAPHVLQSGRKPVRFTVARSSRGPFVRVIQQPARFGERLLGPVNEPQIQWQHGLGAGQFQSAYAEWARAAETYLLEASPPKNSGERTMRRATIQGRAFEFSF